jgi:hypothetical protein
MTDRMNARRLLAALLLAAPLGAAPALAADQDGGGGELMPPRSIPPGVEKTVQKEAAAPDETPTALRWMLKPLKRGMFVRLPIIDTDPNRGVTYGVMPIWVLQDDKGDRIKQIHAPSITYNKDFKLAPTYRYYYYPQDDATLVARASRAKFEHEVIAQYDDHSFVDTDFDVQGRVQNARDAGQRFFGLGPNTQKSGEANYAQDYWQAKWALGKPLHKDSPWRARVSGRYVTSRILNGPLKGLPTFDSTYPQAKADNAQQTYETRVSVEYDTRDHATTTSRGEFLNLFAERSIRGFVSMYEYERYGVDARWFKPWVSDPGKVFAIQAGLEQINGATPPFWLLPSLGGKYSLRAYGDGRYADRGVAFVNAEQRIKMYEAKTAGVTTEIQLAPFVGAGTVFGSPEDAAANYVRPVFGAAVRAVARPQVVGSVDFGVGREGLSVFTDINYSF